MFWDFAYMFMSLHSSFMSFAFVDATKNCLLPMVFTSVFQPLGAISTTKRCLIIVTKTTMAIQCRFCPLPNEVSPHSLNILCRNYV